MIGARPAGEEIVAVATEQLVITRAAIERIVAGVSTDRVLARPAGKEVVTMPADDAVVSRTSVHGIVAGIAVEVVVAGAAGNQVVARSRTHLIVADAGGDNFAGRGAMDDIVDLRRAWNRCH